MRLDKLPQPREGAQFRVPPALYPVHEAEEPPRMSKCVKHVPLSSPSMSATAARRMSSAVPSPAACLKGGGEGGRRGVDCRCCT